MGFQIMLYITYLSYLKFSSLRELRRFFLLLLLFQRCGYGINLIPPKSKGFTLVKSPKCYKVGKLLIAYTYFKMVVCIKSSEKTLDVNGILRYFLGCLVLYDGYQSNLCRHHRFILQQRVKLKFFLCLVFYSLLFLLFFWVF